ncbi:MAG: hypothetical protein L3J76_06130, partial [Candidatus Hydrothermae bacterium]|nr:hypothetical protein [Candidatus Hydrothermae bacterium]
MESSRTSALQRSDAGHDLDRLAVRVRGGDLALRQVEGLDELLVLETDQLHQPLVDHLHAPRDRLLVTHPRQAGAVVAIAIE